MEKFGGFDPILEHQGGPIRIIVTCVRRIRKHHPIRERRGDEAKDQSMHEKENRHMANGKNGKKAKSRKKIIWITIGTIIVLIILRSVFCGKKDPGITVQTE